MQDFDTIGTMDFDETALTLGGILDNAFQDCASSLSPDLARTLARESALAFSDEAVDMAER